MAATVAALYVETDGCYFGLDGVDPWDVERDARYYIGPHPVVAHPPCQRWGRFWHGSTRKPHQFKLGDDGGCFKHAIEALCMYGGVLEHPADSKAWDSFILGKPARGGGWKRIHYVHDGFSQTPLWTCCVYQGNYGHIAGKPTWLLARVRSDAVLPELRWGKTEQRPDPAPVPDAALAGGRDAERLDWLVKQLSDRDFREARLSYRHGDRDIRPAIDAAMSSTTPAEGQA